ncbi:MAG: arginine--tRNA ligase [Candidatus Dojkabacteria bacterium]|nr:MAG: arginine--tRNA ligase [Candidatus Dojkabacteria bacterium]
MSDKENFIKSSLVLAFKNAFDIDVKLENIEIERPKDFNHGDYSSNCALKFASQLKLPPQVLAEKLVSVLDKNEKFKRVEVASPGFINFYLSNESLYNTLKNVDSNFGKSDKLKGKKILIEHTSPNPTKAYHIGHFKNTVTGLSISYLFEAMGALVFRDCINNNRGIAISKMMWGYLTFGRKDGKFFDFDIRYWYENKDEWMVPESNKNSGRFIAKFYNLGSNEYEQNAKAKEEMEQLVRDWEAEDEKVWELWRITQKWVWDEYEYILKRVGGWKFDKIWNEHEIYKMGKQFVEEGVRKGIFIKLEDGAIVSNLKEEFGLPDTILMKRDGTSLYITQDIALTYLKRKTFDPDEMNWVIGPEQSLAMKQMFAVCSQLGFGKFEDFHHIPYGFILLKGEKGPIKMSSRKGNVLYMEDLIEQSKKDLKKHLKSNFSEEEADLITEKIAIGALKYSLLKVNRTQDMVFDYETTINFEGDSGPYILYTFTRARSVLSQAEWSKK